MMGIDMEPDTLLRQQLRTLLQGGNAHMTFDEAVGDFGVEHMDRMPARVPYTPWHLLEHLRITQWDILEFIRNPRYISPDWPEGYWPASHLQADEVAWEQTLASFRADLQTLSEMVADPTVNLYAPIPHGNAQTIPRHILL